MRSMLGRLSLAVLTLAAAVLAIQLTLYGEEGGASTGSAQVTRVPYDYGLDGSDPAFERGLRNGRKRYMPPLTEPAISMEQALDEVGGRVSEATNITARYVRFSDDVMCRELASNDCRLLYQDMPAWVFTLEGLNIPSRGPSGSPTVYAHGMHVVVDAETGEYVMSYMFR